MDGYSYLTFDQRRKIEALYSDGERAADVLKRYHAEKNGEENVGRVLPAEYLYFTGDGRNNHFTIGWKDAETWDWSLHNPYDD